MQLKSDLDQGHGTLLGIDTMYLLVPLKAYNLRTNCACKVDFTNY